MNSADAAMADELVAAFARASGLWLSAETVHTALELITSLAALTVPGTVGSGITLLDSHGERVTAAATDAVVEQADAVQYRIRQGPCLTAWADRVVVRIDDLNGDRRWPRWAREAAGLGLRSSLSVPLVAGSQALGALKIYADQPNSYGEREEHWLTLFAAQAALLLANMQTAREAERVSDLLTQSLRGREVMAMAKGIVMARDSVDERTAFLKLTETARQHRMTVQRAAERLVGSTVRRLR
ncbi:GAF and ANTAR domain-containing protein [Nocardia sp. CDC159]|uniref:GAF and ANTAR domain-containing protein n=1 Tax=Nocardia pulmonis TaxID=2951408 RepID=A0A9X2E7Y3_9NOCA|nr:MULTISPECIES: GAF and ANTAR domain-containing protein [Nocardia]MCM6773158.1 GAF and ANTAR domain-containing protein [Nocardia pulmonis]MCM6785539.1 GAF and ANTAR domain-containing protein [Nocardia sp. CDC159]